MAAHSPMLDRRGYTRYKTVFDFRRVVFPGKPEWHVTVPKSRHSPRIALRTTGDGCVWAAIDHSVCSVAGVPMVIAFPLRRSGAA
jgi:hypothetical protein